MPNVTYTQKSKITTRSGHHRKVFTRFVAIDGEGENINGKHEYVLIGIGQDQLSNSNGLEWWEVFEFLYSHYDENCAYVGFFLGYDFTQWFKSLPQGKAYKLLAKEGIASRKHRNPKIPVPHPVQCRNWQFDILGNKRFRFRPKVCECEYATCKCRGQNPWMYICDSGPFFQKAFLSVINPKDWPAGTITTEEYETIKEGKGLRSSAHLGPEMKFYNRLENEILSRIMSLLDKSFRNIGINLDKDQWFGPGQAAQEWLRGRAPKRKEIEEAVPKWFRDAARDSYFGGWFEIFAHGLIPGIAYEYDINSAYPFVIASLPCLLHGIYKSGIGQPTIDLEHNEISLVYASVSGLGTDSRYSGAMPHRNHKGNICRPVKTKGWYWHHELAAAIRSGCISDIQYHQYVSYVPCECPPPMREVHDLYQKRLEVGKNTPFGLACKLVYNSMYGKFAQSVGNPLFANSVYASLITAGCRTMILDAIATHPKGWEAVLMVATDGVYFTDAHPCLDISPTELGKWDVTEKENLTLFKPGVYWDDKARLDIQRGESPNFKARGVSARDFAECISEIDYRYAMWKGDFIYPHQWPWIKYIPQFNMTTALQALIQNDWSLAGLVRDDREMTQDSWPGSKRTDLAYYDDRPEYDFYRTIPKRLEDEESVPYVKQFGDTSIEASDIPFTLEWQEKAGVTPDEFAGEIFIRAITGKNL